MRPIVLLSPGGRFVTAVLASLHRAGIEADALVVYDRAPRAGGVLDRVRRWVRPLRVRLDARYARGARRRVPTGALNGSRMIRDLARLQPGVVVLANTGLVAPEVLAIPREGVFNVHPGLLPWVRGNSPLGNALACGVPLGATAFRVDPGIDTGAVLSRRLLPVAGGEATAELTDALYGLWVEMTAELIVAAAAGPLPAAQAQGSRFPLRRTLATADEKAAIDEAVRRGTARALLDAWSPYCGDRLTLPPEADAEVPLPDAR